MSIWLDAIFGSFKWYQTLKQIALNIIILTETTGEEGTQKRKKAIDAIQQALLDAGIRIPLPDFIFDWFIGLIIDLIVGFLNSKYGKDWLQKVKEIVRFD